MVGDLAYATICPILRNLSDEHVKMLNLTHDWLTAFAPFVLAKVNRVAYGLLTVEQVDAAMSDPNSKMPRSLLWRISRDRHPLAVRRNFLYVR